MTTQIRQQNGISILEPNGKIVGASILGLWGNTFAANRGSRHPSHSHQF